MNVNDKDSDGYFWKNIGTVVIEHDGDECWVMGKNYGG